MCKVDFYSLDDKCEYKLKYVVIVAEYQDRFIIVKHKDRATWEIPGGRIEDGESFDKAAQRELYEETGALEFELLPVAFYSVTREGTTSYGLLYYSKVRDLGKLPNFEIEKIEMVKSLPENLTYPQIQPDLFKKVMMGLESFHSIVGK